MTLNWEQESEIFLNINRPPKPRDIAKTTEQEKRIILRACLQLLDEHWTTVFTKRLERHEWRESNPFSDAFTFCQSTHVPNTQQGKANMTMQCAWPAVRPLIDMILGLYVLLRPEVFRSTQHVSWLALTEILRCCEKLKLDYQYFDNFDEYTAGYLNCLAQGSEVSSFNEPFECLRFGHWCFKEIQINQAGVTKEQVQTLERNYSKLSRALKRREIEFQNKCLAASAPTSQ